MSGGIRRLSLACCEEVNEQCVLDVGTLVYTPELSGAYYDVHIKGWHQVWFLVFIFRLDEIVIVEGIWKCIFIYLCVFSKSLQNLSILAFLKSKEWFVYSMWENKKFNVFLIFIVLLVFMWFLKNFVMSQQYKFHYTLLIKTIDMVRFLIYWK